MDTDMLPRWRATVYYRTENGLTDVTHDITEIYELHDLVERGPHWDTIARIEIRLRNPSLDGNLTVEAAMRRARAWVAASPDARGR